MIEQAFEDYVLKGMEPSHQVLEVSGLDVKLLQKRLDIFNDLMSRIEGFTPIEDMQKYGEPLHTRERTKSWDVLVEEAGLTRTKVLRFTSRHHPDMALLDAGTNRNVEVFLAKGRRLIVWYGGVFTGEESEHTPAEFKKFLYASDMVNYLKNIGAMPYERWTHASTVTVALSLVENLGRFVSDSVAAKEERLVPLSSWSERFQQTDRRI